MSWAKIDDHASEHPKLLAAGLEAMGLWVCGLMFANRQKARDGLILESQLPLLYPVDSAKRDEICSRLVSVGLWRKVKGGYRIHQFNEWNKTKEQLDAEREGSRERTRIHRENKSKASIGNGDVTALHIAGNGTGNKTRNKNVLDPLRLHSDSATATTPSEDEIRSAHASGVQKVAKRVDPDPEPDPALTICPLDLVETAKSAGIVRDFVERYQVEPEQILDAVREFVSHWTIGGGMGRREANWPRKLRSHLKHTCERLGGLKPIGEVKAAEVAVHSQPYHAATRFRDAGPVMPPAEVKALLAQVLAGAK